MLPYLAHEEQNSPFPPTPSLHSPCSSFSLTPTTTQGSPLDPALLPLSSLSISPRLLKNFMVVADKTQAARVESRAQGLIFPQQIGNPSLPFTAALESVQSKGKRQPCMGRLRPPTGASTSLTFAVMSRNLSPPFPVCSLCHSQVIVGLCGTHRYGCLSSLTRETWDQPPPELPAHLLMGLDSIRGHSSNSCCPPPHPSAFWH